MFQKPRSAKRLYFDVIPRAVDEYLQLLAAYPRQDAKGKLDNAVWHIHGGEPPAADTPLTFALLLNLVAASNADDKSVLWGFIRRHVPGVEPETHPLLDQLAGYAVRYYADFVKPRKKFRPADEVETGGAARALGCARHRQARMPQRKSCRPSSTTSAAPSRAIRTRTPRAPRPKSPASPTRGSTPSMRCCSARRRARASARS